MEVLNYLYNNLPEVYRREDEPTKPLYRFLSSLAQGGFDEVSLDTTNLITLLDPLKCPDSLLKYFYTSFGLTYFPDIEPIFHRKILANLGGIIRRRGTHSCVHFLARAIMGTDIETAYSRDLEDNHRILTVTVICDTLEQVLILDTESEILQRFLTDYVPYYISVIVERTINVDTVSDTRNDVILPTVSVDYTMLTHRID